MSDVNSKTEAVEVELERPSDFTVPDELYKELVKKVSEYYPNLNLELLHRAYMTAKNAHMDQKRKSGEPYFIHVINAAYVASNRIP